MARDCARDAERSGRTCSVADAGTAGGGVGSSCLTSDTPFAVESARNAWVFGSATRPERRATRGMRKRETRRRPRSAFSLGFSPARQRGVPGRSSRERTIGNDNFAGNALEIGHARRGGVARGLSERTRGRNSRGGARGPASARKKNRGIRRRQRGRRTSRLHLRNARKGADARVRTRSVARGRLARRKRRRGDAASPQSGAFLASTIPSRRTNCKAFYPSGQMLRVPRRAPWRARIAVERVGNAPVERAVHVGLLGRRSGDIGDVRRRQRRVHGLSSHRREERERRKQRRAIFPPRSRGDPFAIRRACRQTRDGGERVRLRKLFARDAPSSGRGDGRQRRRGGAVLERAGCASTPFKRSKETRAGRERAERAARDAFHPENFAGGRFGVRSVRSTRRCATFSEATSRRQSCGAREEVRRLERG